MSKERGSIEALSEKLGREAKPAIVEIERGLIKRFVEAIGDTGPLWQDESYAQKTSQKGIIAPPQLFCSSMLSGSDTRPELSLPYERILDGGGEWEFLLPVRPGDVITSVTKFTNFVERQGKAGKMVFLTFETFHRNQKEQLVAVSRTTLINLE